MRFGLAVVERFVMGDREDDDHVVVDRGERRRYNHRVAGKLLEYSR